MRQYAWYLRLVYVSVQNLHRSRTYSNDFSGHEEDSYDAEVDGCDAKLSAACQCLTTKIPYFVARLPLSLVREWFLIPLSTYMYQSEAWAHQDAKCDISNAALNIPRWWYFGPVPVSTENVLEYSANLFTRMTICTLYVRLARKATSVDGTSNNTSRSTFSSALTQRFRL